FVRIGRSHNRSTRPLPLDRGSSGTPDVAEATPQSMWFATRSLAALLGALFGGYDPTGYFGAIPPGLRATAMSIPWGFLVGWCVNEPAEAQQVSEPRALLGGIVTSCALSLLMIAAGYSRESVSAGAFYGFVGGIATIIYPRWAIGGAVLGLVLGIVDL